MNMNPRHLSKPSPAKVAQATKLNKWAEELWPEVEKFVASAPVSDRVKASSLRMCARLLPRWVERHPKANILTAVESIVLALHDKETGKK